MCQTNKNCQCKREMSIYRVMMWQGLSVMPHAVKACEQFPTYQDGITPEPSIIVNNEINR